VTDIQQKRPTQLRPMVVTKPIAPPLELDARQELALMARILWQEGHQDHLAGHITYRQPDGNFLVNPFGLTWGEIKASDVMVMDEDGHEVAGPWTITPAIELHVQLHKARPGITVALHNHTRWGTIWADIGRAPEIFDQTSAMYHGEVAVYDEYWGAVDDEANAKAAVTAMGDANIALLANHGVFIVGDDIEQAYLRAMAFEWRSRQAWHMAAAGGGKPMNADAAAAYGGFFNTRNFTGLFPAMCRAEVARDPSVLQ